jgi:guanylate kinase
MWLAFAWESLVNVDFINDQVFVVSSPSGCGKSTLNRRLVSESSSVKIVVSHTTRQPRAQEVDGREYFFVSEADFTRLVQAQAMLEWANVHGCLYGTSYAALNDIVKRNQIAVLEIDVQGWESIRTKHKDIKSIFILPPSMKDLRHRLTHRGSEDLLKIELRLKNALHEISEADHYDYYIINDDIDDAFSELKSIVVEGKAAKLSRSQGLEKCQYLLAEWKQEG